MFIIINKITHLGVPVNAVGTPATRFDLVGVQTPKLQLFFKKGAAYISGVVQLSSSAKQITHSYGIKSVIARSRKQKKTIVKQLCSLFFVVVNVGVLFRINLYSA